MAAMVQDGGVIHAARGVPQGHAPVRLDGRDRGAIGGEREGQDGGIPDPRNPSRRLRVPRWTEERQPGQDDEPQQEQTDPPAVPRGQSGDPAPGSSRSLPGGSPGVSTGSDRKGSLIGSDPLGG